MRKCSVAVTVDGWVADGDVAPTFRVGDTISGKVDVWVTEAVRCAGLDVALCLKPTQKGFSVPEPAHSVRLFAGEWAPGEYEYRFQLTSTMPPTHQGKLVGWKWVARAVADVSWALDPVAEAELGLEPPATWGELVVVAPPPDAVEVGKSSNLRAVAVVLGVFWALAGLLAVAGFGMKLADAAPDEVTGPLAAMGTMGTILLGIMFFGVRAVSPRWRSAVRLTVGAPAAAYRGDGRQTVRCEVDTKGGGEVERVSARLDVKEYVRWTSRSPSSDSTTTHEYEELLSRAEVSLTGDPATGKWSGELPVPEIGGLLPPYTMADSQGRGLVWRVDILSYRRGSSEPGQETRYLMAYPASSS